jgi:hypothetical protein
MSILHSPNIITNGLVLAYDMNNRKSYTGPPLQNRLSSISATSASGTGYVITNGTEVVDIPTLGPTTVTFSLLQNTGESWCCVNQFNYGSASVSGSTLYTYFILYKIDSGYTGSNFMYRYEYNGGTYVTEAGVHDTSKRIYLGDGWYYAWNTFTTQPTTSTLNGCASFNYQYSSFFDKMSVAKVAIVQGDYSGMHPKYWPALGTTVANTESIKDVTNNNIITANSLTYANNGTFSFNGSSSYLSCPPGFSNFTAGITLSAWVYYSSSDGGWTRIFDFGNGNPSDNFLFCRYSTTNNLFWGIYPGSASVYVTGGNITFNGWAMYTATADGSNMKIYVNGVLAATLATSQLPTNITRNNNYIGKSNWPDPYLNGNISVGQIYNKALTEAEVQQNFNALRGRYGL